MAGEDDDASRATSSPPLSDRPRVGIAVRGLVALAAAYVLFTTSQGWRTTSSDQRPRFEAGYVDPAQAIDDQFQCVQRELDATVPEGSTVFVKTVSDLWQQRLAEMSFTRLVLVDARERSTYTLDVVPAADGECVGVHLQIDKS